MSLLPAACKDSTQDTNAVIAMRRKNLEPTVPNVSSRIDGIGSATSPSTMAWRFGAAST